MGEWTTVKMVSPPITVWKTIESQVLHVHSAIN